MGYGAGQPVCTTQPWFWLAGRLEEGRGVRHGEGAISLTLLFSYEKKQLQRISPPELLGIFRRKPQNPNQGASPPWRGPPISQHHPPAPILASGDSRGCCRCGSPPSSRCTAGGTWKLAGQPPHALPLTLASWGDEAICLRPAHLWVYHPSLPSAQPGTYSRARTLLAAQAAR